MPAEASCLLIVLSINIICFTCLLQKITAKGIFLENPANLSALGKKTTFHFVCKSTAGWVTESFYHFQLILWHYFPPLLLLYHFKLRTSGRRTSPSRHVSYTTEKLDTHPRTTIPAAMDNQKPGFETTYKVIAVLLAWSRLQKTGDTFLSLKGCSSHHKRNNTGNDQASGINLEL